MDENFLLYQRRALRLLELMQKHDKSWALYVFSSANALRRYTMEQLVGLGVSWVWMGLEGEDSQYQKLQGTDTRAAGARAAGARDPRAGLDHHRAAEHTPENIDEAIDYAVEHDTEFHQFMLYTPVPGTPLYEEQRAAGTLLAGDRSARPRTRTGS